MPLSTDATLSALTLSDVDFGTFSSATESYTASVAYSVSQTTVTPTINDSGASYVIEFDSKVVADGTVSLAIGENIITIEVIAEDDSTKKTYTVTVTRAAGSTDATLSSLTLTDVDFGTFSTDTESYTASVANTVSQTTVTPTVNDSGASYVIELGGAPDADGTISLAVGSNVITVEVKAEDDITTKTYTVTVTRAAPPSTDATLKSLTLSGIDIGAFSSDTTSYTVSVANSVSRTTVMPTVNHSGATYVIKLGGVTDSDGAVSLAVGNNVITVVVTAEDGQTTKTYTVTVTRAAPPSSDATLKSLSLSKVIIGTFSSVTTSYTAQVAHSVSQTTVTPTGESLRGDLYHQAQRRDRLRWCHSPECGREQHHHRGNRRERADHGGLHRHGYSRRSAVHRCHAQSPGPERRRHRDVRGGYRIVHRVRRRHCNSDDGYSRCLTTPGRATPSSSVE